MKKLIKFIEKNKGDILGLLGILFTNISSYTLFDKGVGYLVTGLSCYLLCYLINRD